MNLLYFLDGRHVGYRIQSPIDEERFTIMLLASEGKISVKSAIERVSIHCYNIRGLFKM